MNRVNIAPKTRCLVRSMLEIHSSQYLVICNFSILYYTEEEKTYLGQFVMSISSSTKLNGTFLLISPATPTLYRK